MTDRWGLYHRWHSLALIIGTRAAGKSANFQGRTTGSRDRQAPSAGDWMERQELTGGMVRWLSQMDADEGDRVDEQMAMAIGTATGPQMQRLLGSVERAEWLLKIKWEGDGHRQLKATEADQYGRDELERTIIMSYRGTHTKEAADELGMTVHSLRWIRRKHGLTIKGERMYPCTVGPRDSCMVCEAVNTYSDDYDTQEAA